MVKVLSMSLLLLLHIIIKVLFCSFFVISALTAISYEDHFLRMQKYETSINSD